MLCSDIAVGEFKRYTCWSPSAAQTEEQKAESKQKGYWAWCQSLVDGGFITQDQLAEIEEAIICWAYYN
jgi:hypothetical protein